MGYQNEYSCWKLNFDLIYDDNNIIMHATFSKQSISEKERRI